MKKCEQCGQLYEDTLVLCPHCDAMTHKNMDADAPNPDAADVHPAETPPTETAVQHAPDPQEVLPSPDDGHKPPLTKGQKAALALAAVAVTAGVTAAVGRVRADR